MWESIKSRTTTCTYCPNLCLHACPVSNAEQRATVSPWGKMSAAHWASQDKWPLDRELAALFYKCTGCGACKDACVQQIDVADTLLQARQAAVAQGIHPHPRSVFGAPEEALREFTQGLEPASESPTYFFVPGCEAVARWPEDAALAIELFEAFGGDAVQVGSSCCGALAHRAGFEEAGARKCTELLLHRRGGAIVAGTGECEQMLRLQLAAPSNPSEVSPAPPPPRLPVLGWSEALAALVQQAQRSGAAIAPVKGKVALVQGCIQQRQLGASAHVQALAARMCEQTPLALRWTGSEAHCCGAAGGLCVTSPDTALAAGARIVQLALDAGASALVSFDLACASHLRRAAAQRGETRLRVWSGVQLVAAALGARIESEAKK